MDATKIELRLTETGLHLYDDQVLELLGKGLFNLGVSCPSPQTCANLLNVITQCDVVAQEHPEVAELVTDFRKSLWRVLTVWKYQQGAVIGKFEQLVAGGPEG